MTPIELAKGIISAENSARANLWPVVDPQKEQLARIVVLWGEALKKIEGFVCMCPDSCNCASDLAYEALHQANKILDGKE